MADGITPEHVEQAVRNLRRHDAFDYFRPYVMFIGCVALWVFALGWLLGMWTDDFPFGVLFVNVIYTAMAYVFYRRNRK